MQYPSVRIKPLRTQTTEGSGVKFLQRDAETDGMLSDMKKLKSDCDRILRGHRLPKLQTNVQSSRVGSANWALKFPKVTINVNNEFFINGAYQSARTQNIRLPPITAKESLSHFQIPIEIAKDELNETGRFPEEDSISREIPKKSIKTARSSKATPVVRINLPHHRSSKMPLVRRKKLSPKIKDEPVINVTFSADQFISN